MPRTQVVFKPSVHKEYTRLTRKNQEQIAGKIDLLARDPRTAGEESIRNSAGLFRVRQGDYRIAYLRQPGKIVIVKIGHRREIYAALRRAGYIS